ncbi:hypothetical protein V5O48_006713 [Marasmius crinis-equi]|uniref:Transmembrane protein n=1 Tax=Marasmius crinis-equi TaxID=585013 RepID=A0ABR3FIQ4_9AGAR
MFSLRITSLYLVSALAGVSVAAPYAVESRCDATCAAKSHPVPVILADVKNSISPMLAKIQSMPEVKADDVSPIVDNIKAVINDATNNIQSYVDNKVDRDAALASDSNGGPPISVDVLVKILVDLVLSIVVCIKAALSVCITVDLSVCITIFASLCVTICGLLAVLGSLVVELLAVLMVELKVFVDLCVQLGVGAAVSVLGAKISISL